MRISLVVAMARRRVIGKDGRMPWHLPADLERFKAVTLGKPVVMGRKTFESIGRALPGRRNIVMSRDPAFAAADCVVVGSLEEAFAAAEPCDEVAVIGGAAVYASAIERADRIYVTVIDADIEGDTFFPSYEHLGWEEVARSERAPDERNRFALTFLTLERRPRSR